ncbi:MAG TPA: hypothetical protein VF092_03525 [Longimicrobium sp.]
MRRKKLELDTLSVDSFPTAADDGGRGTVRAHLDEYAAARGCTCRGTCLCPTAYYNCGTGPFTIYSCDYTANNSCTV